MKTKFCGILVLICLCFVPVLQGQVSLDTTISPEILVKEFFLGNGLKIRNVRFKGSQHAIAKFYNPTGSPNFKEGILLTTGNVMDAAGPNAKPKTSTVNRKPGDNYLKKLAKGKTYDAAILEFDFMPEKDSISFRYFFASEEYNEYVGSEFNDVFAFQLTGPGYTNGKNLAVLPGSRLPVTVNNVNYNKNRKYYLDNNHWNKQGLPVEKRLKELGEEIHQGIEFDGMTVALSVGCKVKPRQGYHIRISIADVADETIDSGVFLETGSFNSLEQVRHTIRREAIAAKRRLDSLDRVQTYMDSIAVNTDTSLVAQPDIEESPLPDSLPAMPDGPSITLTFEEAAFTLPPLDVERLQAKAKEATGIPGAWIEIYCPHFEDTEMVQNNRLSGVRCDWVKYTLIEAGAREALIIMKKVPVLHEDPEGADRVEVRLVRP